MGAIKDLKSKFYGNFLNWLKLNKMEDPFDNDVWAIKIFDRLYEMYEKQNENMQTVSMMPVEIIQSIVDQRKKQEDKLAKKIVTPDKKIVT